MSDELERQVERGSLFTHTALSGLAQRTYETESIVLGLVDVLLGKGVIDENGLSAAANDARDAMDERGETTMPGLPLRSNPRDRGPDRGGRLRRAHARLPRDLLQAQLRAHRTGDRGRQRQVGPRPSLPDPSREDGFCTHCDRGTGACGVYDDRPAICRAYSCAGTTRIWKDFDNMVLNDEWIAENLVEEGPRLLATAMVPADTLARRAAAQAGSASSPATGSSSTGPAGASDTSSSSGKPSSTASGDSSAVDGSGAASSS